MTILIKGARPYGEDPVDVLVQDGVVAAIGTDLSTTAETIDATGLVLLPMVVADLGKASMILISYQYVNG